jgi:erythromycin esterase-like protein
MNESNSSMFPTIPAAELSPQVSEVSAYVEAHRMPVNEVLRSLVQGSRFVMVGEAHLPAVESVRAAVAAALTGMQQAGLTHVALEASSSLQQVIDALDYSDPGVFEALRESRIGGAGWFDGNLAILVQAKRLGLRVVLVDHNDGRPDSARDNAEWQNTRDAQMTRTLLEGMGENDRALVFIGSRHVHKREVESYMDGRVKRIGARLAEIFGDEQVRSVRYVGATTNFDNLLGFMSQTPTPADISTLHDPTILPDDGAVKGDPRVSAADYIITVI